MACRSLILSEDVHDILVDYSFNPGNIQLNEDEFCYLDIEKYLGVLYVPAAVDSSLTRSQYRYSYIPKCYAPMQLEGNENDLSFEVSGIYRASQRPLNLTGKQVLIGFIDTGIRSSLSVFQNPDGSTRIFAVWDQTDQSGQAPEGFYYGSEYRKVDGKLQDAATKENVTITDESGHGTAAASIAISAAMDAEIVMVKCKRAKNYLKEYYAIPSDKEAYSESDLLNGIAYLERVSQETGRPLVICFTMGTNMGDHMAGSILDDYLRAIGNRREHAVVIAGGNEGNRAHHYEGVIDVRQPEQYDDVEIQVSENVTGFMCEIWGSIPATYSISLRSPDGEVLQRLPLRIGNEQIYSFVYSDTVATIGYVLVERASAEQLITIRFDNPLEGIWTLRVYAQGDTGLVPFQVWLPIEEFLNQPVYFLRPDPFMTMTEPAYIDNAISLSYYDARNGSIAINSGRGYDRRGLSVPALSAPGILVPTAIGPRSGSSMSAALTAGAVAQFLEWAVMRGQDPLVNSRGVRNYFIRGAVRQSQLEYPNPVWGYGTLSITGIFSALASS